MDKAIIAFKKPQVGFRSFFLVLKNLLLIKKLEILKNFYYLLKIQWVQVHFQSVTK